MSRGGKVEFFGIATQQGSQLVAENFDNLLTGFHGFEHLLAHGLLFHVGDELARHAVLHIGIQQSHAHIAQGILDVGLGNSAQPAYFAQGVIELV